jgi:glucosamine-6-phosphate deaminase
MREFKKDQLIVRIYKNRRIMGEKAARDVAERIKEIASRKETVNMVFAAAPSQDDFLKFLVNDNSIDWSKVAAFHLDEYVGLDYDSPKKFGFYLNEHLFKKVNLKQVYYIDRANEGIKETVSRYSELLRKNPMDIACIGIGENGHIAFNDPHVADFTDTVNFKVVKLDQKCRQQQVNDGCFKSIDKVPTHALTMTIPAILSADYIYTVVPTSSKSKAVEKTINGPIEPACPASILRSHQRAFLYLEEEAAELLD